MIAIYTTLFQPGIELREVYPTENIDYICFTNRENLARGWTVRKTSSNNGSLLEEKKYKIQPHLYLSNYEYSIYISSGSYLFGDIEHFVEKHLKEKKLALFYNQTIADVATEAKEMMLGYRHSPNMIMKQAIKYFKIFLHTTAGGKESYFIWRCHNNKDVMIQMQLWWSLVKHIKYLDKFYFNLISYTQPHLVEYLPKSTGTMNLNVLLCNLPDLKSINLPKSPPSSLSLSQLKAKKIKICFIYSELYKNTGSTIMRGKQLSQIISEHREEQYDIEYTSSLDIKNAIIILTKGILKIITLEQLGQLKQYNIALLADFVDDPVRHECQEYIDINLASSIKGLYRISNLYPDKPCHLLTHHVDPRIAKGNQNTGNSKICYVGELANAKYSNNLDNYIDFVSVNTNTSNSNWIESLPSYDTHYLLRSDSTSSPKICKPFLKGYTAAHCDAQVITSIDDGDALYYLGEDYPYLIKDSSLESVQETCVRILKGKGSIEWSYGMDIMKSIKKRSSIEWILNEFDTVINSIKD